MIERKFPARPSPSLPIKYQSLEDLIIREGKALSGRKVGSLNKGETVTVNQVKGRRARLIKRTESSTWVTLGWVSLRNVKGKPLLTQVFK